MPEKDTDPLVVNVVTFSHGESIGKRICGIKAFLLLLLQFTLQFGPNVNMV